MRATIGVFGTIAGLVLLSFAAVYGYNKGEGQAFERAQLAFLYMLPTGGGLFGFGLAAKAWHRNTLLAIALFLCALAALGVSLSISIGAMAERTDGVEAVRTQVAQNVGSLQADLAMWRKELAGLIAADIKPADRIAEGKANEIAATASGKAKACEEEGKVCKALRTKADEAEKEAKTVSERREATERKAELSRWIADGQKKADMSGPVRKADAQASVLAYMFGVEIETAAQGQRLALLIIAEIVVALANAYAEIMKEARVSAPAPVPADKEEAEVAAPAPVEADKPAAKKRTRNRTQKADTNVVQLRRPLTLEAVLAMRKSGQGQKQVAAYFGVSERTIRRYEAAGQADKEAATM
jgi:hypothetical protein